KVLRDCGMCTTTTTAHAKSPGRRARICFTACMPPEEAPKTAMSTWLTRLERASTVPAQRASGPRAGVTPLTHHRDAVHEHMVNAGGRVIRILERAHVAHACGIEQAQVGEGAGANHSAVAQAELARRETGHAVHGRLEREEFLVARVSAQHTSKR